VPREAKRHAALEAAVQSKAVSPLRFATAVQILRALGENLCALCVKACNTGNT